MSFSNKEGFAIAVNLVAAIQTHKDDFSRLDGAVGDGDHGINMSKGFTLASAEFNPQTMTMSDALLIIGQTLMNKIGGSMGPLYGGFFSGLGSASQRADTIDKRVMGAMLQQAQENVRRLTTAAVGDKTLIDVLEPAVAAYRHAADSGEDFAACLLAMTQAGAAGLDSTRNLVAKVGRASRLGERTLGHLDAGAASCHLILTTLADGAIRLADAQEQ